MDDRWAIIAFVTDPAHLFPVSCLDGLYIYTFNECSPISSTGWGLAPTLVPNLDAAVVVFKLDDLHLILVNPPPPHPIP